jgi:hypothetical protein
MTDVMRGQAAVSFSMGSFSYHAVKINGLRLSQSNPPTLKTVVAFGTKPDMPCLESGDAKKPLFAIIRYGLGASDPTTAGSPKKV